MKRGKLIVLDGPDFSGKKTQTGLLYQKFQKEGLPVEKIRFPSYEEPAGRIIGQCLLGKKTEGYRGDVAWFGDPEKVDPLVASMYYAADRRSKRNLMNELLDSGVNLISDRYYQANMGHQGAKMESLLERQRLFRYIEDLELNLNQIPREDLCILLFTHPSIAIELSKNRKEIPDKIEENWNHIDLAYKTYTQMYHYFQGKARYHRVHSSWLDTPESLKSPEEIHEEIFEIVKGNLDF